MLDAILTIRDSIKIMINQFESVLFWGSGLGGVFPWRSFLKTASTFNLRPWIHPISIDRFNRSRPIGFLSHCSMHPNPEMIKIFPITSLSCIPFKMLVKLLDCPIGKM